MFILFLHVLITMAWVSVTVFGLATFINYDLQENMLREVIKDSQEIAQQNYINISRKRVALGNDYHFHVFM